MGPSPRYHPPEGEECETSVEHGLPLWAEPAVGYCSRRPRPSPMWGSRFVGAREVGPWVGEQIPLGKSPLRGNPSPESTYLPTYIYIYIYIYIYVYIYIYIYIYIYYYTPLPLNLANKQQQASNKQATSNKHSSYSFWPLLRLIAPSSTLLWSS